MKANINSKPKLLEHIDYLLKEFDEHKYLRVDVKSGKQRTSTQNAALHLYCEQIAEELKSRGITFEKFFKSGFEVPWTMEIVKDNVWRKVQDAIFDEISTSKMMAKDYTTVYDSLNTKLIEWDINIPWPNKDLKD